MKEETLNVLTIASAGADEMARVVDAALWSDEESPSSDDSDVWDDSQNSWDGSGERLDTDVWEEDEHWMDI